MSILTLVSRVRHSRGVGAILARGAGGAFTIAVLGTALTLMVQLLLARMMGASQFGVFVYVWTCLNVMVLPAMAGTDTALVRFLPAYGTQGQWGLMRGVQRRSQQVALVVGSSISLIVASVIWMLGDRIGADLRLTFWIGCGLLPLLALLRLAAATLRSMKSVVLAGFPESVLRPILMLALIGILHTSAAWTLAPAVMLLQSAASIAAYALAARWIKRRLPEPVMASAPEYRTREWIATALPMLWIGIMQMISARTSTVLLGALRGTTEAGLYATAANISRLIGFGLTAVLAIAAPLISELYATGRREELQRMLVLTTRGMLATALPIFVALAVCGRSLLGLFGSEFVQAHTALVLLALGQLADALSGPVNALLMMTGHERKSAQMISVSAALNVVLCATLIPHWGIDGAAAATTATLVFWNVMLVVLVRTRLGLRITIFEPKRDGVS